MLKIGYNAIFTARIAYSADFFQSQVPRTKRYLLYCQYCKFTNSIGFTPSSSLNLEDNSDGGEGAFEPDQAPGHLGRQAREETEDQGQEVNW